VGIRQPRDAARGNPAGALRVCAVSRGTALDKKTERFLRKTMSSFNLNMALPRTS
jgi:hypothetical protein